MARTLTALALAAAALAAAATAASAGTRRVAIVVGNNAGDGVRPPLHYAEIDAEKFADVLGELGGVAADDLFLLQGKDLAALDGALARAKERIAAFHRDAANRVVVLFYFSGHSDGEALELGRDRLEFTELRRWLASSGADVRVALVDSCKSGALLEAKGGTPGPAFQIRLTDDVASTGEALLTSSAADEVALESREIGGSFFTHHFISGLRGAADTSGDGIVTLNEAYQYAYAHTIKTTGETIVGPQHPAYDYRLSGQGELVLAELSKPTASLALPKGFERILVADRARGEVIAEVGPDARGTLAVKPGEYAIRAWRGGKIFAGRVAVAMGEVRDVRVDELAAADSVSTASKGDEPALPSLYLAAGGEGGVADGLGLVPGMRAEVQMPSGVSLALTAGSRTEHADGAGFRETSSLALVGYRRGLAYRHWRAWAGIEAGGGIVVQSELPRTGVSGAIAIGALAGASFEVSERVSVAVEPTFGVEVLRRDARTAPVALPGGWFGVVFAL